MWGESEGQTRDNDAIEVGVNGTGCCVYCGMFVSGLLREELREKKGKHLLRSDKGSVPLGIADCGVGGRGGEEASTSGEEDIVATNVHGFMRRKGKRGKRERILENRRRSFFKSN